MSDNNISIKAENLSKCFRIGVKENMHDSIAKSVFSFIKSPVNNFRKHRSLYKFGDINNDTENSDIIWALRNVSFEVKKGEILGLLQLTNR